MAQLELSVVLNLANFRTQLGKLAQASAAYYYPINLTIDKQAFKKQLAALGNIKPVIKIEDSQLDGARARIATLNKSLATLRRATSTAIEIKVKYKEEGRPAAGTGAVGRAITGRAGGEEALANKSRGELQKLYGLFREANLRVGELSKSLTKSSAEEIRQSLVPAFSDSGKEAVNGLAIGLKDPSSKISKAAKRLTVITIQDVKKGFGIASPSRVFKEIGKDLVAGLEIGFEDFNELRAKMVGKMRELVAVMRMEAAKIQDIPMTPGMSRSAGSRGSRQYMSPIGPLPEGSKEPWAFSQYRYQPFIAQPGQTRGANVPPMRARFPFAEAPSIMGTTTSPSMFGASFPALPSAGMTGGNAVRQAQLQSRMAAAYARSAAREASVLGESQMYASVSGQVPLGNTAPRLPAGNRGGALALRDAGPQTPLSLDYYKNAVKYSEALRVADASTRNFSASQIPLIGGIKNLAGEFGQAAKQVLLYGTAYKGLAFLTSLPGQILNAAKSQQQFANGLQTATQDTGTFAKELLYVDNVQRAFGLNLETTRTGFTRLYASMAPTGFDSGSIEKLFTGISAATASLQLTPDKAERVIYAFGQMASKGQIMSEELKGQLGDVLPGALAIFAKSAGMSVKEFSKAMEDGEFVGNRFREVFAKVSDELMNRFGTGAQAAGRSLQGLINTVGGDFQRTLESFAPLANSAAQAILGPLGGSLKQLALSAQIATGEIERVFMQLKESQQNLEDLRTSAGTDGIITAGEARQIKAAEQNVAALTAKYKGLQQAASDPAIAKQAQDITKFTEELGKAGTFVMNVAKAIGGILSPVLNFLGTNLTTVISLITSFYIGFQTARLAAMALMGVLLLYRTLSAILGFGPAALGANALATAFNALGIAATGAQVKVIGLRLALTALVASTVIGAVVGGIMLIAGAFASMRDRANEASQSSRDAAKAAIDAAQTGGVAQAAMSVQTILGESRKAAAARKALEGIMARSTKAQRAGVEPVSLTMEESVALKGSPLTEGMVKPAIGGKPQMQVPSKGDAAAIIRQFGSVAGQQDLNLREAKSALATAQKVAKDTGLNIPTPGVTPPETLDEDKTKTSLESYYSLQDQLAKAQTQADIDRIEAAFEHRKELINNLYDLEETRANSIQKEAIAHQRAISNIFLDLQKKQIDARLSMMKAEGSVAGGAPTGSGGSLAGMTQYITGDPSHPSYKPDHGTIENYHDHLAFASREAAIEAYNKLTKSGIQATEFQGFGRGVTGPHSGPGSAHHKGLAMDVPGAQWGGPGAIGERAFAGSARVRATLGMGGGVGATPGKVTPDTKRDKKNIEATRALIMRLCFQHI
jgi:tape measure domain-containing protein